MGHSINQRDTRLVHPYQGRDSKIHQGMDHSDLVLVEIRIDHGYIQFVQKHFLKRNDLLQQRIDEEYLSLQYNRNRPHTHQSLMNFHYHLDLNSNNQEYNLGKKNYQLNRYLGWKYQEGKKQKP